MATDLAAVSGDAKSIAVRSIECMAEGSLADFEAVVHPDAVNHEADAEPPDCRGRGPGAFHATAQWLRAAFADLRFEIITALAEGDLVAVNTRMSGRHVGTFVVYTPEGKADQAFAPTRKTFDVTQTHWLRIRDGKVVEHWANRDDFGQARQLGWAPPSPVYLLRCALAKRSARNALQR